MSVAVRSASFESAHWLLVAWSTLVAGVAVAAIASTGVLVLLWAVPLFVVSSLECGIGTLVPIDARRDYRRLATITHVPMLVALLGGAVGAAVGQDAVGVVVGLVFGLIGLTIVGAFVFSAIQTRRSRWKALGPIWLSFIAINTVVAGWLLVFVPGSLTGSFG
jgi:hypothetical protein